MMITLVQDQSMRVLLLPPCPAEDGRVARDFIRDKLYGRLGKNENLSRRYVDLARRISKRTKTRIPSEVKRYLCKGCGIALVPGHNARVRLHAHNTGIVITCLSCGSVRRYPVNSRISPKKVLRPMKPYIAQTLPFPKKNSSKE